LLFHLNASFNPFKQFNPILGLKPNNFLPTTQMIQFSPTLIPHPLVGVVQLLYPIFNHHAILKLNFFNNDVIFRHKKTASTNDDSAVFYDYNFIEGAFIS
jgi:hypothetical protein